MPSITIVFFWWPKATTYCKPSCKRNWATDHSELKYLGNTPVKQTALRWLCEQQLVLSKILISTQNKKLCTATATKAVLVVIWFLNKTPNFHRSSMNNSQWTSAQTFNKGKRWTRRRARRTRLRGSMWSVIPQQSRINLEVEDMNSSLVTWDS